MVAPNPITLRSVTRATWEELTGDLSDGDLALMTTFRELCLDLPDVTEQVNRTEVAYAGRRIFASAFVRSHRLEPAIHLLRQVDHPLLRMAFPTTNRVVTHRLHAETPEEVRSLLPLIVEAHETVAGGTR